MTRHPVITLTTDFGGSDEYVGSIKGVLLSHCSDVQIIDLTHEVPPQNIRAAAHILNRSYSYFPQGTIHLIIVDPGVGSNRRIVAIQTAKYIFIGPDNGLLSQVIETEIVIGLRELSQTQLHLPEISNTFHGRDIMAPVAARLAAGMDFSEVGRQTAKDSCIKLAPSSIIVEGNTLLGEVTYVDHFGNLCTNIGKEPLLSFTAGKPFEIQVGDCRINHIGSSYSSGSTQEPIAIFDSHSLLEITEHCGNISKSRNLNVGHQVLVVLRESQSSNLEI